MSKTWSEEAAYPLRLPPGRSESQPSILSLELLPLDSRISITAFRRQTSNLSTETFILSYLGIGPMNHSPSVDSKLESMESNVCVNPTLGYQGGRIEISSAMLRYAGAKNSGALLVCIDARANQKRFRLEQIFCPGVSGCSFLEKADHFFTMEENKLFMVIFGKFFLMLLVILNLSLESGHGISPLTIVSWALLFLGVGNSYVNNIPYGKPEHSIQHKTIAILDVLNAEMSRIDDRVAHFITKHL